MASTTNDSLLGPPDFSEPWKFSDVVLVVEDQKFHVHRSTLSIWSPVFETMLTSMFKEKNMYEIPLPDKKASEIKELLLFIYPTVSETGWTTVTNENCYFLGELAEEYQMDAIMQRCENFLVKEVYRMSGNTFLTHLTFAQTHKLETLIKVITDEASKLSLDEFKSHEKYDNMDANIYKQIVEQMIRRHEGRLGCRKSVRVIYN